MCSRKTQRFTKVRTRARVPESTSGIYKEWCPTGCILPGDFQSRSILFGWNVWPASGLLSIPSKYREGWHSVIAISFPCSATQHFHSSEIPSKSSLHYFWKRVKGNHHSTNVVLLYLYVMATVQGCEYEFQRIISSSFCFLSQSSKYLSHVIKKKKYRQTRLLYV